MLLYASAVATQARLFRVRFHGLARRVLVRVVAIDTRDLAGCLPPALAVAQRGDLIGNQQIVGQRILYDAEPGVAL
jgi:hypothetical protein